MQISDSARIVVIGDAGHRTELSSAEITEAIANIAAVFQVAVEFVANSVRAIAEMFGEIKPSIIELFENVKEFHKKEAERDYYRELHKLDFTRPSIKHQIICRKPRHLVKKIIR